MPEILPYIKTASFCDILNYARVLKNQNQDQAAESLSLTKVIYSAIERGDAGKYDRDTSKDILGDYIGLPPEKLIELVIQSEETRKRIATGFTNLPLSDVTKVRTGWNRTKTNDQLFVVRLYRACDPGKMKEIEIPSTDLPYTRFSLQVSRRGGLTSSQFSQASEYITAPFRGYHQALMGK